MTSGTDDTDDATASDDQPEDSREEPDSQDQTSAETEPSQPAGEPDAETDPTATDQSVEADNDASQQATVARSSGQRNSEGGTATDESAANTDEERRKTGATGEKPAEEVNRPSEGSRDCESAEQSHSEPDTMSDEGANPEAGSDGEGDASSAPDDAEGNHGEAPGTGDRTADEESTPSTDAGDDGDAACESEPVPTEAPASTNDGNEDTTGRREPADLTPDEVEVARPEEFEFRYLPDEQLPRGVQYTPEFDPQWVYPSGGKDGGTQDDVPVQGLEIGVLGTEETLEAVIEAVLEALELYYDAVGEYPRHRVVDSAATFRELTDGAVGLVAVFQPRPDDYEGLTDHMTSLQKGTPTAVDTNHNRAHRLVQYLAGSLVYRGLAPLAGTDEVALSAVTGWEAPRRVGATPIIERYGPLAATEVYDPTDGPVDVTSDGVDAVTETDLAPTYLDIEDVDELF